MQISFRDALDASAPRLVVTIVEQGKLPVGLERTVSEGAVSARFAGKAGQLFECFVEQSGRLVRRVLVGGGPKSGNRRPALERAGAALAAKYLTSGEEALALDVASSGLDTGGVAAALTGLSLRSWRHDAYRTKLKDEQKVSLKEVVVCGAPAGTEAMWRVEQALVKGVEFTRDLVAEPGNIIYPVTFVQRCLRQFEGTGAQLSFLNEDEMLALGMGALLGVSQGSEREARLLVIKWMGGDPGTKPTVFVGKGVTFDTGGISLKPGAGMEDMKWDMGGAGAVAGAMLAIAGRKAKANVIGVCGLVENMPDGKAIRPGDVLTTMSGQTVEIINTDAEGRLVLCDALTWAQKEFDPAVIVDLATLTGAMIIALGAEYGGMFSNNDKLANNLLAAGAASGDKLWRLPLGQAYDKLIDSPIADVKNAGPRAGGSITAAQFLQRFIESGTPWAHLDIAGMVWADKPGATWDKGATGFGARLIDRYVRDQLEG